MSEVILTFGFPQFLHANNGSEFINVFIKKKSVWNQVLNLLRYPSTIPKQTRPRGKIELSKLCFVNF